GEEAQQPTLPQARQSRRCTQSSRPSATHPIQLSGLSGSGSASPAASRWAHAAMSLLPLQQRLFQIKVALCPAEYLLGNRPLVAGLPEHLALGLQHRAAQSRVHLRGRLAATAAQALP